MFDHKMFVLEHINYLIKNNEQSLENIINIFKGWIIKY